MEHGHSHSHTALKVIFLRMYCSMAEYFWKHGLRSACRRCTRSTPTEAELSPIVAIMESRGIPDDNSPQEIVSLLRKRDWLVSHPHEQPPISEPLAPEYVT